jgi:hypothetical protein
MTLEARVRECAALLEQDRGALAGRAAAALAEEAGLRAEECWGAARPRDDEAALLSVFVQRFAAVQGCESADCKALEAAFEAARLRRGAEEAAVKASRAKLPPETREAAAAALREHPTLRTAFSEYCEVLRLLQTLGDNGGWESIANASGVQTLFRAEADAATLSIKTLGVIDSPIFNVVALINEIDLLGTFIPRVYARMLRQISRFRQLVHVLLALPWPFASRDVVLEGRGVDMLEHNAVVVTARNVEVPQEELPPECRSDAVRVGEGASVHSCAPSNADRLLCILSQWCTIVGRSFCP